MTDNDKRDIFEVAIAFGIFLLTLSIGFALIDVDVEQDKCPQSHNVIINGVWSGCTGDNTNARGGWYPGIDKDNAGPDQE